MTPTVFDIAGLYEELKNEVEPLFWMARASVLQMAAVDLVNAFVKKVEQARISAITKGDESAANTCLGFSHIGRSFACELETYLFLKQDNPEAAWDRLIDAQEHVSAASRACEGFTNLIEKFSYLREMESSLFPPQVFISAGFIVRSQHCSICQDDYDKCAHIAGRPYMGRFCNILLKKIIPDHVAIVESPVDRRCIVKSFAVPGGVRNRMTWVVSPKESDDVDTKLIVASKSPDISSGLSVDTRKDSEEAG